MADTTPCSHCGATVPPGLIRPGEALQFCCDGCRTVYAMLNQAGAADFYTLRERGGVLRPESCQLPADSVEIAAAAAYDDPAFIDRFVTELPEGRAQVDWYIGGVHCAACVWLLERLPELAGRLGVDGIIAARLDFGSDRLRVLYQRTVCSPRMIADAILKLGYHPHPWRGAEREAGARAAMRDLALRVLVAGGASAATMHLGLYIIGGEVTGDQDHAATLFFGWLSCLACLPVLLYSAQPYLRAARAAMRMRRMTVDTNIALVVVVGFTVSLIHLLLGRSDLYFDAVAMFVCFLLAARLALQVARERVTRGMEAMHHLLPRRARRLAGADDAVGEVVPVEALRVGDTVLVERGDQLPCDGRVLQAALTVDASLLSGESRPVILDPGALAHAGTRCLSASARLAVTAAGEDTRMGALLAQVRGAGEDRPMGGFVARLNAVFAPAVLLLALLTALLWWWLDPTRMWDQVIALILAACPCAIGLAAPLTYALATGRALRHGILLRDAGVIERLAGLRHAVFDKTGTLTAGRMQVVRWDWADDLAADRQSAVAAACLAIEERSAHPIALAISEHLRGQDLPPVDLHALQEQPGAGIEATCDLGRLRIGSPAYCGVAASGAALSDVAVSVDGALVARIQLDDPPRLSMQPVLDALVAQGAAVSVCSGDAQAVTSRVAATFGINQAEGGMAPEAKAERVVALRATGTVLMVGDGLNDAPALSQADIAVGVRGGLQAAMDCSHVFLEHDDTALVGTLLQGAAQARRCIHASLWVSLAYNLIAIVCVMAGWWGPLVCAVAMPVSSLTVVVMVLLMPYFDALNDDQPGRPSPRPPA